MPSHCHLLLPARGWTSRFGCQPPASVTCLVGGRAALVTRDRLACHTTEPLTAVPEVPQTPVARLPALGSTAALHPRRPPGLSKGTAGPALSRPSIPSKSRDVYRIRPHSQQTLLSPCSGGKARGRHLSQPEKPPRERGAAAATSPPPCAPRDGEGKGLRSPETATY